MLEAVDDIWNYHGKAIVAITTSGSLTKSGKAVLGRGVARQAGLRFPDLPVRLGELLRLHGNHVQLVDHGLVSFPVEESAWACPELRLIARSAEELRALADREGWARIVVPRPGCGGGGLEWKEVRPLLEVHFDERFVVISQEGSNPF